MVSATDTAALKENGEVRFCTYCGTKLDVGARFCKGCGKPIGQPTQETSKAGAERPLTNKRSTNEHITERKTVYEGYIHKCPNCGEVLESFVTNCPSCGYEIRDAKSASTVREFAMKLERIEAQKMPVFEGKKSVMKMVFGKDFKEKDETEEARDNFEERKQQEKATLIINYPVPNTKEDIMEFMLLATSNIGVKHGIDDVVSKAWISKLGQVYQKAELSMGNSPDFEQIKSIYTKEKKQIKYKKVKGVLCWGGGVAFWFFLLGLLWNPTVTISIVVSILVLMIIGFIILKKK